MNDVPQRGPEILAGTWEHEWMTRVVRAVEQRAGRSSQWNGKLYEEQSPGGGRMDRDGSMSVHRAAVLEPARVAVATTDQLSSAQASAAGNAAALGVHLAHLSLSTPGDDRLPGATELGSLEDAALDQALADRWTQHHADEALYEEIGIGWNQAVPSAVAPRSPAYTTATDTMMYSLSGHSGVPVAELRATLETTGRAQRLTAIADRIIDHKLEGLMPEAHRAEVREAVSGPVRRELRGLTMTELSARTHPGAKSNWGHESAQLAMAELEANLEDIESHYRGWQDEHPGTEPPRMPAELQGAFRDRQEEVREIWADRGWPAQEPVQGYEDNADLPNQAYPSPREQEMADLQKFMWSHTAPGPQTKAAATTGERATGTAQQPGSRRDQGRGVD